MRIVELTRAPEPALACEAFLDLPGCALLESVGEFGELARWSFLAADPFLRLSAKARRLTWSTSGGRREEEGDPFTALQRELARWRAELEPTGAAKTSREPPSHDSAAFGEGSSADGAAPDVPTFHGGALGYFAYDLLHHLERVPAPRFDDLALPDLDVGFHDWVVAWDHARGRAWVCSSGLPDPAGPARDGRAEARLSEVLRRLERAGRRRDGGPDSTGARDGAFGTAPQLEPAEATSRDGGGKAPHTHPVGDVPGLRSTFSREAYLRAVARCREYVLAGDVFQVNLSQRLSLPCADTPLELYRRLRSGNPAPFSAFLAGERSAVLSVSPERFLRVSGDRVETRPIKGTAARGYTPAHDLALREDLVASEKNRAENVMIVDLLRNDLSRVAIDGTVRVPELWRIERHPTVHHLVSTVTARLRPGLDAVDVLRAAFPGGSITGAPKVRAMEIIHELEPTRRSVYCGSIGYIGWDGEADLSIAIRTVILKDGVAHLPVGGAVTADSEPDAEHRETLLKAAGMLRAWNAPAAVGLT